MEMDLINKPELLAPAGDMIKLKMAILYGADAVYIAGESFGLRGACKNFTLQEMREAAEFVHSFGKKIYLAANIIPHNSDLKAFEGYIAEVSQTGIDAIIVADLGMFALVRRLAPELCVHISTQANNVNYLSAQIWHEMGASRVILARELSLEEIVEMRKNTPPELELEAFVHGAMCVSYSGRCLLSNYMAGRDANKGECAQPCRWNYSLVEEKRPGQYMNIVENERGTFIMNSKDLCMLAYIPELVRSGISSFKIEGRVKSEYYVATVVKAYREEINLYFSDPEAYKFDPVRLEEVMKVSHRPYSTGFFFQKPDEHFQVYTNSSYIRNYDIVGLVLDYNETTKVATITQRNRFFEGDEVEVMQPGKPHFTQVAKEMKDTDGLPIQSTPHPEMVFTMPMEQPVCKNAMIRKGKIKLEDE